MFTNLLGPRTAARGLATVSKYSPPVVNASASAVIKTRLAQTPQYKLTTVRSFPSLEPVRLQPVSSSILGQPLRRDLLWRAVVFEADQARVGSSNTRSRAEMGYSRKKLRPQKGTGRARMGDRGSPTRHDGGRAFARHAPFDWSTGLPRQIYGKALRTALSHIYETGNLFVVEGPADFVSGHANAGDLFISEHGLADTPVLFIVDEFRENLHNATKDKHSRVEIISKEGLEVRDLLKAHRVIIEQEALVYLAEQFQPELPIPTVE
ncbi:hypothetical protein D0Z03_001567 [Geotrichum reessii]|nr:hypothetical protein D0Z03_001567 [Galactomyces reessii]